MAPADTAFKSDHKMRFDLLEIGRMIEPGSRVLDIGCGDGALLDHLVNERGIDARGLEISRIGVNASVARGLSVIQGDANTDLVNYPTGAFDYVILSQTLQAMVDTKECLKQLLRIGNRAIVSFPNFGYWRVRLKLMVGGRMPYTRTLKHPWYNTPNIHLCTIADFVLLCEELGITIEQTLVFNRVGQKTRIPLSGSLANLFGDQGLFLLRFDGQRDTDQSPLYAGD